MNEQYKSTTYQKDTLVTESSTFYKEFSVINATPATIVCINSSGARYKVEPAGRSLSTKCKIIFRTREGTGPTIVGGLPALLPCTEYVVDYLQVKQQPVYIQELDLLVCTVDDSEIYSHPYERVPYTDGLAECLEKVEQSIVDAPSFRILANDPTNSFEYLYTVIDTKVTKIPVTHINGEYFELVIIVSANGRYSTENIDLTDFITGKENTMEFQNRVIPFITTSELNANEMIKEFRWITPSLLNEITSKLKAEQKAEIEQLKKTNDSKIAALNTKITEKDNEISKLKLEAEDYKAKYTILKNDLNAANIILENDNNRIKIQNGKVISNNDVEISKNKIESQKQEYTFKLWHLILAAAVPTIGALTIEVIRACSKK